MLEQGDPAAQVLSSELCLLLLAATEADDDC